MSVARPIERVPPQNLEAEQSVLGSMLLDRDAIARVVESLRPEDFYRDLHRTIYTAVLELFERGEPVDLITVTNRLSGMGKLDDVGGATYLASLPNTVPTAANAEFYAGIVLEKSMLRALISAGTHIASRGFEGMDDVSALIDQAEKLVYGIAARRHIQDFQTIKEILKTSFEKIDKRYQEKGTVTGVATGFTDFDMLTSGLQPADMVIVAARPSVGKTTWASCVAQHAAITQKIPVAVFSLETSKEQLVQRILCSEARVDNTKLRTGFLADEDWRKLARAMGNLSEAPIFIDDSATLSVMEMRAKARKLKAEHGLGLIVIDYIQMIQSYKRAENRTQELSEIARGIKSLAKELDIPIIAISQLSRAVEALGSKRPMLSHLRECVTGDTILWDADTGRRHTVGELAGRNQWPRLLSLDRTGKLVPVRPTAVIEKGTNAVFEMRTSTGRRIRATADHPILTPDGWKPLRELTRGARVAAARVLPVFHAGTAPLTPDRLRLLGYLIGDGSYQRHRGLSFISADPATFEDCIAIAEREFNVVARRGASNGTPEVDFATVYPKDGMHRAYGRPHGNPLREWLRELGIEGQSTYNKRIPDSVFVEADHAGLRSLLRALFSTDGCLTRRTYHRNGIALWSLHYDSVSLGLAEDVRDLLLRFGIISQISSGYKSKKGTVPIYRVCVEDARQLAAFCQLVGIEGRKGALVNACAAELATRRAKPQIDRLPYSVPADLWGLKNA
ncbi:MAG: replicative DNA helicase, partial [Bacillati bacterium ANGP1]